MSENWLKLVGVCAMQANKFAD